MPHLFVLFAFTALLIAPLTAPGYFMFAHDARHTVYFMQMFDAALRDGALYPRWATDMVFGYGYPLWLIFAPLPYYAAEFFYLLGLDFPAAIKATEAVGWLASGLTMYLYASCLLGKDGGLVAAVAYLFIPYHIVDLYVRGAAAEFLAFVFPPLILWALHKLLTTRHPRYVPLAALAYAGLILTHISMAVLFSPVLVGYILVLSCTASPLPPFTRSPLLLSILALAWGLALAAIFLFPVVAEQRYLTSEPLIGGFFDFRLHFLNPSQLVSPFWGYGYAGIHGADQFSLQLGLLPLFFSIIALFTLKPGEATSIPLAYFALVVGLAILGMLAVSAPLWELAAPVVAFAQFPWRLLFVTASPLAILAGASLRALSTVAGSHANAEETCRPRGGDAATLRPRESPRAETFRGALLLSLLMALAMFPHARPQYTDVRFTWNTLMDFQVNDRELLGDTVWTQKRPQDSSLVAQYRAGKITQKAVVVEGIASIELLNRRPLGDTVRVNAATPARIMFYTRYFPGWSATLDGIPVEIEPYGEQGLIALTVPAGTHIVTTRFGTTAPRVAGAIISFGSFIAALAWLWKTRR